MKIQMLAELILIYFDTAKFGFFQIHIAIKATLIPEESYHLVIGDASCVWVKQPSLGKREIPVQGNFNAMRHHMTVEMLDD